MKISDKDILVIYHAKCTDGFGAAYAAWKKFGDDAFYLPMDHGETPPDVTGKTVFILDFSFSLEVYNNILNQAKSVKLLDHHKSAYFDLKGCPGCVFNMKKSGATMAWKHFHPGIKMPKFFHYIEDGDLANFSLPETKDFFLGIHTLPHDFKSWGHLEDEDILKNIVAQGHLMKDFFAQHVKEVALQAKNVTIDGFQGIMVNAPVKFANDIGGLLLKQTDTFVLIWSEEKKHIKCSLRSHKSFDCSKIAANHGGGGHPHIAAFKVKNLQEFDSIIKRS